MSFTWIDRDRQSHALTDPQPIVDEVEAASAEIDGLIALFENPEAMMRDAARNALVPLQDRLEQLRADLARWNAHADQTTWKAAAELIDRIAALPEAIAAAALVVALHDERDALFLATAGDAQAQMDALAAPMTATQVQAIAAVASRTPPRSTATRAEATAWLDRQPRFARSRSDDGGWFVWTDRDGHVHRLVDPLRIERELMAVAAELGASRIGLIAATNPVSLFPLVEAGVAVWNRIRILQYDLTRFDAEAEARDIDNCRQFAADWRTKRNTT